MITTKSKIVSNGDFYELVKTCLSHSWRYLFFNVGHPPMEVYFSPNGRCAESIIRGIDVEIRESILGRACRAKDIMTRYGRIDHDDEGHYVSY